MEARTAYRGMAASTMSVRMAVEPHDRKEDDREREVEEQGQRRAVRKLRRCRAPDTGHGLAHLAGLEICRGAHQVIERAGQLVTVGRVAEDIGTQARGRPRRPRPPGSPMPGYRGW